MIIKFIMVGNLWFDIYWNFNFIKYFDGVFFFIVGSFLVVNGFS